MKSYIATLPVYAQLQVFFETDLTDPEEILTALRETINIENLGVDFDMTNGQIDILSEPRIIANHEEITLSGNSTFVVIQDHETEELIADFE